MRKKFIGLYFQNKACLKTSDGMYEFSAEKVDNGYLNIQEFHIPEILADNVFLSYDSFVKQYNAEIDNYIKGEVCNCSKDGKNILKISRIEKVYPKLYDEGIIY